MSIKSNGKYLILRISLRLLIIGAIVYGCMQKSGKSGDNSENHLYKNSKVYVCSMHPQVLQNQPGDCPICGMMLIEKVTQNDAAKEKVYVCSMHPQVIQNKPGDCPVCGMMLIEKVTQNAPVKEKVYFCSMHPQVVQNHPGDCPICGMFLVEKTNQAESQISDELINITRPVNESVMASVQTITPVHAELPLIIAASGIINFDSQSISTVSAKFGGLIERSYIKFAYQPIRKGQKIYDIYCPEIYNDHWNYINIMKKFPDQPKINQEARQWLDLLGLTDKQIEEIIKSEKLNYHLSVYSQVDGFVVRPDYNPELSDQGNNSDVFGTISSDVAGIGMREGQIVETGTTLFKVLNTERVRADLRVRTEDMGSLQVGQKVVVSDAISPQKMFNTTVSQIEPLNGGLFQLIKVYLKDKEKLLLPGRQIQAFIHVGERSSLWIPKSAIVNLGQKKLVFLLTDQTFVAVNINTGFQSGDKIEVLSGIDPSSQIALNASLLTDSDGFIKSN